MRLETFSYLPRLSDEEVGAQVRAILERGLVVAIEYTDDPNPYDHYWTLWKLPLFGVDDADVVLETIADCRSAHPRSYVRVNGYDPLRQGQVVAFVVHQPEPEL
jgi:ribulose-bisphosphate carboxylase small chain